MTTPLCHPGDIAEGQAKGFPYRGGQVVVVRRNARLFVYENRCPHFGVNLDFQQDKFFSYDEAYLQCAMHGALFEVETGACIAGPCRGQPLTRVAFELVDEQVLLDQDFVPAATTRTLTTKPDTTRG